MLWGVQSKAKNNNKISAYSFIWQKGKSQESKSLRNAFELKKKNLKAPPVNHLIVGRRLKSIHSHT
jgi:hypothetical protein